MSRVISIADLMIDHQEFHSDLQMDAFITQRNGGTLYGCYKQALREVATRIRALRDRYFGIEMIEAEIAEHEERGTPKDLIQARQKRSGIPEIQHALEHTEREFLRFYGQAAAIRQIMESQGISFPLDDATRHRLDCEFWVHQLKVRAAIQGFSQGRPDSVTLELIQSLPQDLRKIVCEEVFSEGAPQRLMDWFLTYENPIPAPLPITMEPRKLIGLENGCTLGPSIYEQSSESWETCDCSE
jgi:hypothetical protein